MRSRSAKVGQRENATIQQQTVNIPSSFPQCPIDSFLRRLTIIGIKSRFRSKEKNKGKGQDTDGQRRAFRDFALMNEPAVGHVQSWLSTLSQCAAKLGNHFSLRRPPTRFVLTSSDNRSSREGHESKIRRGRTFALRVLGGQPQECPQQPTAELGGGEGNVDSPFAMRLQMALLLAEGKQVSVGEQRGAVSNVVHMINDELGVSVDRERFVVGVTDVTNWADCDGASMCEVSSAKLEFFFGVREGAGGPGAVEFFDSLFQMMTEHGLALGTHTTAVDADSLRDVLRLTLASCFDGTLTVGSKGEEEGITGSVSCNGGAITLETIVGFVESAFAASGKCTDGVNDDCSTMRFQQQQQREIGSPLSVNGVAAVPRRLLFAAHRALSVRGEKRLATRLNLATSIYNELAFCVEEEELRSVLFGPDPSAKQPCGRTGIIELLSDTLAYVMYNTTACSAMRSCGVVEALRRIASVHPKLMVAIHIEAVNVVVPGIASVDLTCNHFS